MKLKFFSLILAFLLLLTACAPQVTPEKPDDSPESSALPESSEEENSESDAELAERYREDVQKQMELEYAEKLDFSHETVNKTLGAAKNNDRYLRYYAEDPEDAFAEVRRELNGLLPFRTKGSLIGPKAPATYETACEYIRAEFDGVISEAGKEVFETILANMENDSMGGPVKPYTEFAQENFDSARFYLWERYGGCDIENDPYFLTHP